MLIEYMTISIDKEKNIFNPIPFMIKKIFSDIGIEEHHFNPIKCIYKKPRANIILNGKN